jgi:hypothetical protein
LEQKRKANEEMKSYFDAKQELDKHKISITEDVPKFAKSVRGIAEYGYEPKKVIAEFEDIRRFINDEHWRSEQMKWKITLQNLNSRTIHSCTQSIYIQKTFLCTTNWRISDLAQGS